MNPRRYEYLFPVANYFAAKGFDMFEHLIAIAAAAISASGQECAGVHCGVDRKLSADAMHSAQSHSSFRKASGV